MTISAGTDKWLLLRLILNCSPFFIAAFNVCFMQHTTNAFDFLHFIESIVADYVFVIK